jgi:hypothetical protein
MSANPYKYLSIEGILPYTGANPGYATVKIRPYNVMRPSSGLPAPTAHRHD